MKLRKLSPNEKRFQIVMIAFLAISCLFYFMVNRIQNPDYIIYAMNIYIFFLGGPLLLYGIALSNRQ